MSDFRALEGQSFVPEREKFLMNEIFFDANYSVADLFVVYMKTLTPAGGLSNGVFGSKRVGGSDVEVDLVLLV